MELTEKDFVIQIGGVKFYNCRECECNEIKGHYKFCPLCGENVIINKAGELEDED